MLSVTRSDPFRNQCFIFCFDFVVTLRMVPIFVPKVILLLPYDHTLLEPPKKLL